MFEKNGIQKIDIMEVSVMELEDIERIAKDNRAKNAMYMSVFEANELVQFARKRENLKLPTEDEWCELGNEIWNYPSFRQGCVLGNRGSMGLLGESSERDFMFWEWSKIVNIGGYSVLLWGTGGD